MRKIIVMLAVCLMMVMMNAPYIIAANAFTSAAFQDVPQDFWAFQAVNDLSKRGVISGYEDGTFKPQSSVTREEFAKLIAATFNMDLVNPSHPDFSDVLPNRWSYQYVETAKGYLTGYYPPNGKAFFDPESLATREDVAVALVKVLGLTTGDLKDKNILSEKFTDVDKISYSLRNYVAIATERSLINGYDDGTFGPEKPVTRAEAATLIYRCIKGSNADANAPLPLEADVFGIAGYIGSFQVGGSTETGAIVTINDRTVTADEKGNFDAIFHFDKEGTYTFDITATKGSKTTHIQRELNFTIPKPVITFDSDIPETTSNETLIISGSAKDPDGSIPKIYLYLNDVNVDMFTSGQFSKYLTLKDGANTIKVKAIDSMNESATVTKSVYFDPVADQ